MFHRIRLEVTAGLALALGLVAFLMAMRGDSPQPGAVAQQASQPARQAAAGSVPEGAIEADIVNFAYSPEPVRARVGQAVAWRNRDSTPHTVTAQDRSWGSKIMAQSEVFVTTFDAPGTYVYFCELHPPSLGLDFRAPAGEPLAGGGGHGMQGTVIVEQRPRYPPP